MTTELRKRLEEIASDEWHRPLMDHLAARAALAEIDRLTAEAAHWKHLYESQHMPRHDGFKPTEAP